MSDETVITPLAEAWGKMTVEQKQLVQSWCLKSNGTMYAVWKNGATEEELEKFLDELEHAIDRDDWRYFGRVDEEGEPSIEDEPVTEEAEAEAEPVKQDPKDPELIQDKVFSSFKDGDIKALLKYHGYKPVLEADTIDYVVDLESIRVPIPQAIADKGDDDILVYIKNHLLNIDPTVENFEPDNE